MSNNTPPSVPKMKNEEVPSVLLPPDQILVKKKPAKLVYDLTKSSEN